MPAGPTQHDQRSDLALAMAGLGLGARPFVRWAAERADSVVLDATAPDLRPRTLDRSARRDLAAMLRRAEVGLAGLDLLIPRAHFTDAAHLDRAVSAVLAAIDMAAELAPLVQSEARLCVQLTEDAGEVGLELQRAADDAGVTLCDLGGVLRTKAFDAAAVLLAGQDPSAEIARLGSALGMVRCGDAADGVRVPLGSGDLDLLAFSVGCTTAAPHAPRVLDLRGVHDATNAVTEALDAWSSLPRFE